MNLEVLTTNISTPRIDGLVRQHTLATVVENVLSSPLPKDADLARTYENIAYREDAAARDQGDSKRRQAHNSRAVVLRAAAGAIYDGLASAGANVSRDLEQAAYVYDRGGKSAEYLWEFGTSLKLYGRAQDRFGRIATTRPTLVKEVAYVTTRRGLVLFKQGDLPEALRHYREARNIFEQQHMRPKILETLYHKLEASDQISFSYARSLPALQPRPRHAPRRS